MSMKEPIDDRISENKSWKQGVKWSFSIPFAKIGRC